MKKRFFSFLDMAWFAPVAVNHDTTEASEEIAFGTAINVAPIDEAPDDWINVSPYGVFPNAEYGTQVVDSEAGEWLVTAFNSILGKLGRLFRGVPIYRGHPHQRPDIWPDDARYGRINALEARDDGIYGKVSWNDLGVKNKEQGYYVFPSPGWRFKKLPDGRIKPYALDHVGLTNNPNIFEAVPLTNSRNTSAASAKSEQQHQQKDNMNREALITALGLKAEATDAEILTAINSGTAASKTLLTAMTAINATSSSQFQEAVTGLPAARDEAKKFKKLAIDNDLDLAVNDGRITAAERPQWATKFEEDFDKAQKELKEKQPALNTKSLGLQPNGRDLSDPQKNRIAFNVRLDELTLPPERGGKGLSLNAAIDFMRSNEKDAALLKAMGDPAQAEVATA
jgi:phage I-like protein